MSKGTCKHFQDWAFDSNSNINFHILRREVVQGGTFKDLYK
jgi:hypothetical protein